MHTGEIKEQGIDVEGLMASGGVMAGDPQRIIELAHKAEEAGITDIVCSLTPGVMPQRYLLETIDAKEAFMLPEFAK